MKILILTHIYPPAVDGGSRVISKLGDYLQDQKHHLLIITSNCASTDDFVNPKSLPPAFPGHPHLIRLPVYKNLRRPIKLVSLLFPKNTYLRHLLDVFQKGPVFQIIPFLKALSRIKAFRPDLIVAGPLPTAIILYARLIQKLTASKLLINASFHPTDPDFHKKPLVKTLRRATHIWGLTQSEKEYFQNHLAIDPSKIITVGNGTDPGLLLEKNNVPFPKNPNLLFIGAFAAHKGIDTLIEAFCLLQDHHPHLTLTLAGAPTLHSPQIQKQINSLPVSVQKQIKVVQCFPQSDLPRLIDNSTILVLPSAQESFGLVLLEAWARQKPVVTSDIPALSELVSQTHGGLTFKLSSAVDLSNQIQKLLSQPISLKLHGLNGYRFVKNHYTWDKIGHKLCTAIFS